MISIRVIRRENRIVVRKVSKKVNIQARAKRGLKGSDGEAATIEVGSVTTGAPGTPVFVTNSGTESEAVFNFTIPEGEKGDGSATQWGGVQGDIQDQTDLQAQFDTKYDASNPDGYITQSDILVDSVQGRNGDVVINKTDIGLSNVPNLNTTTAVSQTHTHANKTLLDSYSQTNENLTAAVTQSHTHSNKATLDATTASFTTADETKLDGIAPGATQNASDASLRDRTTHTGTQAISTVTDLQTALDSKATASALTSHTSNTSNPHSTTKAQVGLSNVDNTADTAKPVSTAQQTALNEKVSTTDPRLTDARTPLAHTHGGADITGTGKSSTTFLRGDGTWSTPAGGGGVSGITRSIVTISGATTLDSTALTDVVALITSGGAPTLPTAVGNTNRYTIKNVDTIDKTLSTTSGQTIDGSATITLIPNQSVDLVSDGNNWRII